MRHHEELKQAKFAIGQIIHHKQYGYRGVIADVDAEFALDDEWYQEHTDARASRHVPWYQILVDGTQVTTYVAEESLEQAEEPEEVEHPMVERLFRAFDGTHYQQNRRLS